MLERKDVRFKLSPDVHAALGVLADIEQTDISEFVEMIIQREVIRRVHQSTLVANAAAKLGLSGIGRDSQGESKA